MSRQKKQGRFVNCFIREDIVDRMTTYSSKTAVPKTAIVEKALQMYLDQVDPMDRVESNECY